MTIAKRAFPFQTKRRELRDPDQDPNFGTPDWGNRHVAEVLPQGCWTGHPCVIVGGGPSFEAFDAFRLKGWRTIGVNRAFIRFEPTIVFSMDTRYLNWLLAGQYGVSEKLHFLTLRSYRVWHLVRPATLPGEYYYAQGYRGAINALDSVSLRLEEGLGTGANSGYGALNLAVLLGAAPIYLLGFDCSHTPNGRTHWHAGHPVSQTQRHLNAFISHFTAAAREFKRLARGPIINLSRGTALRCFDLGDPEEVFQ